MSLVCYTIDSESEDDSEMGVLIKEEPQVFTSEDIVNDLLRDLLENVITSNRDFSDLFIKQEPLDVEDVKVEPDFYIDGYRHDIKVEMDSEDEDSDVSSASDSETENDNEPCQQKGSAKNAPRTKNEKKLSDLPPVEELNIELKDEEEVVRIGIVTSCVEELVVIESCPGNPAVDLDSVLFLESGKRVLGRVFDVIGPVARPYYCVRFNSRDHIKEKSICAGMDVFYAPKSEYTTFVFLDQLMKLKISDASWKDDEEPPPQFLDYSDDEEERQAKQTRIINKMVENGASEEEVQRRRARFENAKLGKRRREEQSGNMHYNERRHDNGLYSQTMNPFYRQDRQYNPREMGRVSWNNYNLQPRQNLHPPQNFAYHNRFQNGSPHMPAHHSSQFSSVHQQPYANSRQRFPYSSGPDHFGYRGPSPAPYSPRQPYPSDFQYQYNNPPPSNIRWGHPPPH
eukprot:TRINITY_DN12828_c0_g1_i1.p1 TRINITY_DN12828_c0_g1~~TRINITY_DN12828_c0_g1_i1.p1  ORF type:complete len:465 (+),score=70.54 TRINITY_DN12828_c0_g1_i1:31-1395(+)